MTISQRSATASRSRRRCAAFVAATSLAGVINVLFAQAPSSATSAGPATQGVGLIRNDPVLAGKQLTPG